MKGLETALKDNDDLIREAAARILGEIGDPRAVEPLGEALRAEPETRVRRVQVDALAKIGDPAAVELLKLALTDQSKLVRRDAAWLLEDLGAAPAPHPKSAPGGHVLVVCGGTLASAQRLTLLFTDLIHDPSAGVSGVAPVYTHSEEGADVIRAETGKGGEWTDITDLGGRWLLFCPQDTLPYVKHDWEVMSRLSEIVDEATWDRADDKAELVSSIIAGGTGAPGSVQVQGILAITRRPLEDEQALLQQVVDQQEAQGHSFAPNSIVQARVADWSDEADVYASIRAVFSTFGGEDLIDRTRAFSFQAPDGNDGKYFVLFDREQDSAGAS
jgi:hypothetical protein